MVIATEKKWSSPLIDEESVEKIVNVADHIGIGYAGMAPDFRLIVRKARKKAQLYYRVYHVNASFSNECGCKFCLIRSHNPPVN